MPIEGPNLEVIASNKKQNIDHNVEDFSKTAGKEKSLSDTNKKEESETKKKEGDPVENMNASLYPTEKDVQDWMITIVKRFKASPISDEQKGDLKKKLIDASAILVSQDPDKLIKVRQTLSSIDDEIKKLSSHSSANVDIPAPTSDKSVVPDKTGHNEGKEFKQIVMNADGEGISMNQMWSEKTALSAAKDNLLKLNGLNATNARISNYLEVTNQQFKRPDGTYRTTIKIEGTVTPL